MRLSKNRRMQVSLHLVAIAAQEQELRPRRPERMPGSKRRLKDGLQKRVRLEWISQVRWKKF